MKLQSNCNQRLSFPSAAQPPFIKLRAHIFPAGFLPQSGTATLYKIAKQFYIKYQILD
jgi:hypothetical protein